MDFAKAATPGNRSHSTTVEPIKENAKDQELAVAREYYKVGAAIATALCGSFRGSEVFMLDLAALQKHINIGCGGILPPDPMEDGIDISSAPHVIITLLGEFKGELGFKYHLMSLASTTSSGIELRWWLEKLIHVREEACISGPAFGHKDGLVALIREYNKILQYFLEIIQQEDPGLISETDNVQANYSISCTFQRTAEGRACSPNLYNRV
jgi:hypothetical protein